MKEVNEFEEVLLKRLENQDDDKDTLKRISKSIAYLKAKGYAIERILIKGQPPHWKHIAVSGRIPIDQPIDLRDWLYFEELKCFPYGIFTVEGFQFDAKTQF